MSDAVEERLCDLFVAIERQSEPMAAGPPSSPPRDWARLARVAALMLAAIGITTYVWSRGEDADDSMVATSPPATIKAVEFDRVAGDLCATLHRSRNGVEPRFATPEAYLVVVEKRRDVLTTFVEGLLATAGPADDPGLPAVVSQSLREPRALLDDVEAVALAGRVDDAAEIWPGVDRSIDDALALLHDHGALPC